jgi:hypothetical protein
MEYTNRNAEKQIENYVEIILPYRLSKETDYLAMDRLTLSLGEQVMNKSVGLDALLFMPNKDGTGPKGGGKQDGSGGGKGNQGSGRGRNRGGKGQGSKKGGKKGGCK